MAYHSALTSGLGKVEESKLKDEIKKEFNKTDSELEEENWLDKTSVAGKWRITIDGVYLDVPAGKGDNQDNNKVTIKIGTTNLKEASDLTSLYGETTDFTSVDGVEWKLFYDDTNNIYIIASDYVPINLLPNELMKQTQAQGETKYKAWFATYANSIYSGTIMENTPWSNGVESSTITGNAQTNTYLKWVNSSLVTTKNNPNMKAVAYMMDTSKWSNFAGSVNGAYAIGGPTLEMFALSYNTKHDIKLGTYETIDSTNANINGYMVKIGSGSWASNVSGLDKSSDNMWVKTSDEKAEAMWIATPSSETADSVWMIDYDGYVWRCSIFGNYNGFRPLVSIPKSSLK